MVQHHYRPRGYKTFFMLNSIKNEISNPHKTKMLKMKTLLAFKHSEVVFIMHIHVKMPMIVKILTYMYISMLNFMLSSAEFENVL